MDGQFDYPLNHLHVSLLPATVEWSSSPCWPPVLKNRFFLCFLSVSFQSGFPTYNFHSLPDAMHLLVSQRRVRKIWQLTWHGMACKTPPHSHHLLGLFFAILCCSFICLLVHELLLFHPPPPPPLLLIELFGVSYEHRPPPLLKGTISALYPLIATCSCPTSTQGPLAVSVCCNNCRLASLCCTRWTREVRGVCHLANHHTQQFLFAITIRTIAFRLPTRSFPSCSCRSSSSSSCWFISLHLHCMKE